MPRLVAGVVSLAVFAVAGGAPPAAAQPMGDLPIDTYRPAMDSRGYLTINASQTLGDREVSFGLGSLAWGRRLLQFEAGDNRYSVDDMVTATLIAAVGLRLGPADLELGVSMPLSIVSGDRGPDDAGGPGPNDDRDFKLAGQGTGNLGLHVKTRFLKSSRPPHVGAGLVASLYLPTATANSFMGERRLTPQLVGILDKEWGPRARFRVAVNGGIRLRSPTTFTDMGDAGAPPTNRTISASAELPLGVGFAWALAPQKFDVIGELFGAVPLGQSEGYQPLEAVGGVKLYLARNSFLSLGAGRGLAPSRGANPATRAFIGIVFEPNLGDRDGDGIKDDLDRCPDDPEDRDGFEDEDGCPDPDANDRDGDRILDDVDACPDDPEDYDEFEDEDGCPELDNDRDKILDVDDLCPNEPEDYDGFEDEDGCPDLDNDKDRILDKDDKCPNEPETYNNVKDDDGCPDSGVVIEKESELAILKPINFEYNKAVIKRDSYYILDAVVASLKGNPHILLVEVAGHTDERGDDAYNLDLSIRRAAAVVTYLTDAGVAASRLESQGYGETQPLDPRSTQQAWAKNRRVEFLILKRGER